MPQSTAVSPAQLGIASRVSKATVVVVLGALLARYNGVRLPGGFRYLWALLLLLHWKNLPTVWHWLTFAPLFNVLSHRYQAYWGLYRPSSSQRAKELGFEKADWYISSIGISPLSPEARVVTTYFVGIADSDFNLHLSNSVYAKALDHARMEISMFQFGQLFRVSKFSALLGGTSFLFLKEIPMFTRYSVETMLVAWSDRWFFELHRFSLPMSHKKGRDTIIKTSQGDRVLCTLALSKITCKVGRDTVLPERAVAYCGYGLDGTNWTRTKSMQKQGFKAQKAFLTGETEADCNIGFTDEKNKKALAIIDQLGGHERKSVWIELATLCETQ